WPLAGGGGGGVGWLPLSVAPLSQSSPPPSLTLPHKGGGNRPAFAAAAERCHDRRDSPHRPADHVEPADRGGRGAGAGADAHRVLADRARVRRSFGGGVRPQRPGGAAGGG